ncbi:MAG: beta-ketoacyl synthase chain length factor [Succinivibrio sp.]|nr:beta-ketoacyl synthase chain length factor [Succinivibrio sp.]
MKFSFDISDYAVRVFGLSTKEEFEAFAKSNEEADINAVNPKPKHVPMMTARRLSSGCRLGVDTGMELISNNEIDAVIYSSRSGELEHNYKLLNAISNNLDCSPTDFSMSVHNCGVGNFTILSKKKIPSTSIAAGVDTFMQALTEAYIMLNSGYKKVLLVDYDVNIPEFFKAYADRTMPNYPKAVGLVVQKGNSVSVETNNTDECEDSESSLVNQYQSVVFLKHFVKFMEDKSPSLCSFLLKGNLNNWRINFSA